MPDVRSQPFPDLRALPEGLAQLVRRRLATAAGRVSRLVWNGRVYWLKRPETPRSLRWRLQKGSPRRAFEAECDALARLAGAGAPVPQVLAQGPEFLLVADAGRTLDALLRDPATPPETGGQAVTAVARALAGLHGQGLAHGRPYLRDLCWDGRRAAMIDLEYSPRHAGPLHQGRDVVLFLASLMALPAGRGLADAAARPLKSNPAAWRGAGRLVALMRPLAPLARGVLRWRGGDAEIGGYLRLVARWPAL